MMFYKETNFKETPIGKIPKDWEVVKLNEVVKNIKFSIVDGPFGTQLHSSEYVDKGVPLVRVNNINKDGSFNFNGLVYITEEKFEKLKRSAVYPGDILLAKTGATIGKVCIFPKELQKGLIASSCAKISIDENKVNIPYVFYFLLSNFGYNQILALATGSTRPTINLQPIGRIKIALPKDIKEQRKIAEILSTIDEAIQKTNEIIAKTERLKKGLMQELLTKGIGHKEFKDTEIGRIPKDWEVIRLNEVCVKIKAGGTPLTSKKEYYNGNIPFVKIEDLTASHKYLRSTLTTITEAGLKNSSAWLVPPKSLLVAMYGSIGAMVINEIEVATNQAILAMIPKEKKVSVEFLFYLLTYLKPYFERHAKQTTQANLTAEIIKNFKAPFPNYFEQQKIAEILSTIDKKLELERNEKAKLERIKQGLMDLLLTGKIRVKVN